MVDVYFFTEMPYAEFDEREAANYPSMRLTFPNTYFDPQKAHVLFRNYYDQYQWAEEVGFDGLMINEHQSPVGELLPAWSGALALKRGRTICSRTTIASVSKNATI